MSIVLNDSAGAQFRNTYVLTRGRPRSRKRARLEIECQRRYGYFVMSPLKATKLIQTHVRVYAP
jgi:hypothetical protein